MSRPERHSDVTLLTDLGSGLAARRIDCQLTQAMLATAAGVSKRTVERLETGRSVQLIYLLRVLHVLGLLGGLNLLIAPSASGVATAPAAKRVRIRSARPGGPPDVPPDPPPRTPVADA